MAWAATSVAGETDGVTGFALAIVPPTVRAVSETANGSRKERFFTLAPKNVLRVPTPRD
jgi:hypothetical protein